MNVEQHISVFEIEKSYEKHRALHPTSFEVSKGELFGLIGPDGAGKTTLFRILTTLLLPDSGKASIAGYDVVKDYKQIRKIVGYMPGRFSLYYDLTVEENLAFFATIFGTTIEENYELIKDIYIQIEPFKNRPAGKLSGGMKQKLALSCALIHRPEILVLDEPTTGVDAVSRKEFWELLKKFKSEGITIIVSTPYMDEAALCDRIALIQEGSIMKIDSPLNVIKQYDKKLYSVKTKHNHFLGNDLKEFDPLCQAYLFGRSIHYSSYAETSTSLMQEFLTRKGHTDIKIETCIPTIEDCFLSFMNKNKE
jgi:ABC-2 type transport system ATP-binding protein